MDSKTATAAHAHTIARLILTTMFRSLNLAHVLVGLSRIVLRRVNRILSRHVTSRCIILMLHHTTSHCTTSSTSRHICERAAGAHSPSTPPCPSHWIPHRLTSPAPTHSKAHSSLRWHRRLPHCKHHLDSAERCSNLRRAVHLSDRSRADVLIR